MKTKHNITIDSKTPINDYFAPRKDTLGEIIASILAEDNINCHQLAKSTKIRAAFKNQGYNQGFVLLNFYCNKNAIIANIQ